MKKYSLIFLLWIIAAVFIFAQNPVSVFIDNPLLQNANVSLKIMDLASGKTVCEYRPCNAAIPASTLKLITTATALELLGADFRFKTRLEIDAEITADGVVNGNLYIRGSGDPTLGSRHTGDSAFLDKWAKALKDLDIKRINGKVIADASIFDAEGVNPRWIWQDIGNYYAPAIYGISYLDNTCELIFRSGATGTTPEIIEIKPNLPEISFDNHLKSTTITFDSAYIYGAPRSTHRSIYGAIPANRARFTVKGDIPNPDELLARRLTEKLLTSGIAVSGQQIAAGAKLTSLYTHRSPPLSEIITQINVRSNNHYAEQLFRYLGSGDSRTSTSNAAIQRIKSFWRSKGLPVEQLFISDGSGLSPTNAVSAAFFVELLAYMQIRSGNAAVFKASLPVAGESGTIAGVLKNTALQGKVRAKSGSIEGVRAYAGYIDTDSKNYVFAVAVNNANGKSSQVVKKIEELLLNITK
ncbi:MAG: D-alanyl-D-alanine carboxypeptidase/D-alanyl-D-alanine-endopeptidase [Prevotellaceae bacterium]|nr:D-alanyl-D-alanine carboxypeptidase/D-alanyl-D-alanine-endopeptidase [Prevotellaceae bacterium]